MRQAIATKYLGPTNHRGARIVATCQAGTLTAPWDDDYDVDGNHTATAYALALHMGWSGTWHGGGLPDGTGNAYVSPGRADATTRNGVDLRDGGFTIARTDGSPRDRGEKPASGTFRRHK